MSVKLYAPKVYGYQPCSYFEASQQMIKDVAGGCGPGGVGDLLVPDKMYGLSVRPACSIHDWMYHYGIDFDDKKKADGVFLENMVRIIKKNTKWGWVKSLRLRRARIYFEAVSRYGGPAYWDEKNNEEELQEVVIV